MEKINSFLKSNWKILTPTVFLVGCLGIVFFSSHLSKQNYLSDSPAGFDLAQAKVLGVNTDSICASGATTMPLANTTFSKSYRLLVFTKINGAWPTKDGGYIVSGTTDPNVMMIPPDGFVAKLDKQGNVSWMKLLKTTNAAGVGNPRGEEDVQSIIELKNGGYLMASKVWGFITTAESSSGGEVNKILFTKLDSKGNTVWNKSITAFVEDARNSLVETADKGFLFYAPMVDLAPSKRGEDSDVYQDMPFASLKVLKLDQNGNLKWSKNIKNFIARGNDSYLVATSDGGYVLAGNIAETNPEKELPYNFDTYPGLAKFDKDFNFQWAKSMESTPLDMAAAIPQEDGSFKMGWKKWRQGAIVVRGMARTQDNGYLVLGSMAGLSLLSDSFDLTKGVKNWLVGFKFNSAGNVEWVKKITFGFNQFTSTVMEFSLALTADKKIMMIAPITWADDDYTTKTKTVTDLRKWYMEKYGELEMLKDNNQKTKESQQDWATVQTAITAASDSYRPGIFMMKMDDGLQASWAKMINPQRGSANYVAKATGDAGAIIAGEYVTNVVKSILFGEKIYYKDGFLMKLDASGNVKDEKNWTVKYSGPFVTEVMTPYTVSNDLIVKAEPFKIKLTARKPEFSLYKKSKTTTYAPFKISSTTPCPVAPEISASDTPLINSPIDSTASRTWPQINYEKAVPVEPVNDKSRTLNNELLPILNQLYNNQVKLSDNMGGTMLSYIFGRAVTADDMTAVKNYLVGLGYKTQDEGTYQLTMYKVGYFLNLTFSINNSSKAFLDVTY